MSDVMGARPATVTGEGEIIKKDGTVIPFTLTAETDKSIEELRAAGIDIVDVTPTEET